MPGNILDKTQIMPCHKHERWIGVSFWSQSISNPEYMFLRSDRPPTFAAEHELLANAIFQAAPIESAHIMFSGVVDASFSGAVQLAMSTEDTNVVMNRESP